MKNLPALKQLKEEDAKQKNNDHDSHCVEQHDLTPFPGIRLICLKSKSVFPIVGALFHPGVHQ
jgi:hypothetical protein